jgi:hypothetical protein
MRGTWLLVVVVGSLAAYVHAAEPDKLEATPGAAVAPDCVRDGLRLQRHPAAAFGKTVYLVAWCDGTRQADKPTADIYCARIEAGTGKVLDPKGIAVCSAPDLQEWPAVAFDGTNFLVVWQDLRNGKDYDIYAARVSEGGKVLEPDGFPVAKRSGNQARPAVGFANGNYLVVWMDARDYPVYGLYGTRVSTDGKVLDTEGKALDVLDPKLLAKAVPPAQSWLGDKHYWWNGLTSRFQPAVASNGRQCLITCLGDVHSNHTTGHALLVNPADLSVIDKPVKMPGHPKTRVAPAALPDGWVVALDHWISGWSPVPRLTALRLDAALKPRDDIPSNLEGRRDLEPAYFLDLQKTLANGGGEYQQGKGHFTFWQPAVAWNGTHALVAMDYGWRTKGKPNELNFAVVAARLDVQAGRFLDETPVVAASGDPLAGTSVTRPCLAAGPKGEVLILYEKDLGVDRQLVEARLLRSR